MLTHLKERFLQHRRTVLVLIGVVVFIWVGFFDSHSLLSRWEWHQEKAELQAENRELRADINRLEKRLEAPLTDEEIVRIAREEYGMTRPGEKVYPIRPTK